jgi:hypothetical protein
VTILQKSEDVQFPFVRIPILIEFRHHLRASPLQAVGDRLPTIEKAG